MKNRLLKFCMSVAFTMHALCSLLNAETAKEESQIKVFLMDSTDGAHIEVKGSYNIFDPFKGKKIDTAFSGSSYFMYPTKDGIKWGQEFPGVYQVKIVPDDNQTTILVGGIEYKGSIYAYQVDGTLNFVNELSIDDYAESILSGRTEIHQISNPEVLGAVAIAARTDALSKVGTSGSEFWDVKSDKVGYHGNGVLRYDALFSDALKNTHGMYLKDLSSCFSYDWFKTEKSSLPLEEMNKLVEDGVDAKGVLQKYFPKSQISLFPKQ